MRVRSKWGLAQGHTASRRPFFPVATACPFVPTRLVGHNSPHPHILYFFTKATKKEAFCPDFMQARPSWGGLWVTWLLEQLEAQLPHPSTHPTLDMSLLSMGLPQALSGQPQEHLLGCRPSCPGLVRASARDLGEASPPLPSDFPESGGWTKRKDCVFGFFFFSCIRLPSGSFDPIRKSDK